jgi:hypothetical protein
MIMQHDDHMLEYHAHLTALRTHPQGHPMYKWVALTTVNTFRRHRREELMAL